MTVSLGAYSQLWPLGTRVQIPNVEHVVHLGVPTSVLCYWQELGREGRDGREAFAICNAYDRSLIKKRHR